MHDGSAVVTGHVEEGLHSLQEVEFVLLVVYRTTSQGDLTECRSLLYIQKRESVHKIACSRG